MRLNSARTAWHDCLYSQWNSNAAHFAMIQELGVGVQKTELDNSVGICAHRALAGRIQSAIATLPRRLQLFGHHMYAPGESDDLREEAEDLVFELAYSRGERMYAKRIPKAQAVAAGVLHRYRRMHQGGQSAAADPLPSPEGFRAWVLDERGVMLASESWAREWGGFVSACFLACDDLDKQALIPVSTAISLMLEAA
ncbi:hypothetical protein SA496_14265 [Pseudomonas sp. JS3066]|uniref:hypothetical protein n=1 Tax=Pseudomonas sp. JS3066 TaxID=3090665 RepID=UPI002E7AF1DC|nr:hypothetical protein [Pseudomonas sp. JS3066]WVK90910.1 hypothetical protein SA496_14265 [Pseudomonas sp. JS3066]